jgi:hypothetical protein
MSDDRTAKYHEAYDKRAEDEGLAEFGHLEYDDWLEETGLDDSFVGMPESGIPGTADLYEASKRVHARINAIAP